MAFKLFLLNLLLASLSVRAFKSKSCDHDQVINAVTTYNKCTIDAIKPSVGGLVMKAGDEVDDNAVDLSCQLLKKDGPIMTCAKENLGKCFETSDLEFNLKLAGQHGSLLSMQCYSDDETHLVVENDVFFAWLDLDGINADEDKTDCTPESLDQTNLDFQDCIMNQDDDLIMDTKDVKKAKETATNSIMKCFDETKNVCFSEREMTFLRKDFLDTIEDMMTVMYGMGDLNMDDTTTKSPETIGAIKDDREMKPSSAVVLSQFSLLLSVIFLSL